MIDIRLPDLVMLVMLTGVTSVCLMWFAAFWQERRREVKRRRIAVLCRICGCTYALPHKPASISQCPSCGSKNQRGGLPPI